MLGEHLQVDPRKLHLPPSRSEGADPVKLQRQIHKHGKATDGMPPLLVHKGKNGGLMIMDGVTRATRIAKLLPGEMVTVEVIKERPHADFGRLPTVEEKLP
jgi:hypothetical protein